MHPIGTCAKDVQFYCASCTYPAILYYPDVYLVIIESKTPPEAKSENNHCKVNIEPRHPEDEESEDHTMIVDETRTLLQDQRPKRISFSKLSPVVTPEDSNGGVTVSKIFFSKKCDLGRSYGLPQRLKSISFSKIFHRPPRHAI